ncbi:MAG: hypothetical protein QNJ92_09995 [Alphaproteobacteria bacterium]|nr:hypothetical protein [Alphaproteobacteria bacterium]
MAATRKLAECQRLLTGVNSEMLFGDLATEKVATFEPQDPRFCCIDMALPREGAKIIGLNSQMALKRKARHPAFHHMKRVRPRLELHID